MKEVIETTESTMEELQAQIASKKKAKLEIHIAELNAFCEERNIVLGVTGQFTNGNLKYGITVDFKA